MPDAMSTISDLLRSLREEGFSLREWEGKILVSPAHLLTEAQRQAITANKSSLLALLEKEEGWERTTAALAQLEPDWAAGPVQLLEAVLVRWPDGTLAAALAREEWESLQDFFQGEKP